jgi:hypothetical protein
MGVILPPGPSVIGVILKIVRTFLCGSLAAVFACAPIALAAGPRPATVQAFDQYIRQAEARMDASMKPGGTFLWVDAHAELRKESLAGDTPIAPVNDEGEVSIDSGLIHDWIGTVFIPGTTGDKVLALLQDYNRHKSIYKPEVMDSRLLSRNGNEFRVYMRLLKKKVITVVMNTEHRAIYYQLDANRWYSRSYSTRISEVHKAGSSSESEVPQGEDHGFLWRLNSYWRLEQRDGGVFVECRAISLTRDVPTGTGWLVMPIVRSLPRESLERTLTGTRQALTGKPRG